MAVEILATELDAPSAIATAPDGRVFVAERSGAIRVWRSGRLQPEPALVLTASAAREDVGLVGLALHQDFSTNHLVYVVYTRRSTDGALANIVVRYRELDNVFAQAAVLLVDAVPELPQQPSRIKFGPDRRLYVAFAAGSHRSTADSSASYSGAILRLNEDGSTPWDNPGGSPIIAYGHRAPTAFAWQPATGALWLSERNWADQDQLDRVGSGGTGYRLDALDPSGATFLGGSGASGFGGGLFIAAFSGQHIRHVLFDGADPTRAIGTTRLVDRQFGRISDIAAGQDGALYFCTSDRLARLTAATARGPAPVDP